MSAIIKAVGVKFNDNSLPILSPMITNGLVGAFRPTNQTMGLIDLSGNGHTLMQVGNPDLTENSVIVNDTNGFSTDIRETTDLTFFIVHRTLKDTAAQNISLAWRGFPVGCFYDNRGSSIFYDYVDGHVLILAQSFDKKVATGEMKNRLWSIKQYQVSTSDTVTPWTVSAFVVKASDNSMFGYQPQLQSTPVKTYDATQDGHRLDLRNLADPVTGLPNYIKLGISNVFYGSAKSEIAEVLIYNRALTQDEIMRQYKFSQDFMQKHRGIAI